MDVGRNHDTFVVVAFQRDVVFVVVAERFVIVQYYRAGFRGFGDLLLQEEVVDVVDVHFGGDLGLKGWLYFLVQQRIPVNFLEKCVLLDFLNSGFARAQTFLGIFFQQTL